MLIGVALAVIGLQSIYFGCLAHVFLDYGGRLRERWRRIFTLHQDDGRSAASLFAVGLVLDLAAGRHSSSATTSRCRTARPTINHLGDHSGCCSMIFGFSTFCFTLLLHATRSATAPTHARD